MIAVRNWQRFQHYKDRSPPWIKLYRSLMDNPDWARLEDSAARLLVELWLLASEYENGEIQLSTVDLQWRLRKQDAGTVLDNLQQLIKHGFIESDEITIDGVREQDASNVLYQRERGEAEGETEKRQKQSEKLCAFEKEFSTFWDRYPLKVGKKAALKAYQARRRSGVTAEEILEGLSKYLAYKTATAERHHNPATFLGPNEWFREAWDVPAAKRAMDGGNGRPENEPVLDKKFTRPFEPVITERKRGAEGDGGNVQIHLPEGP